MTFGWHYPPGCTDRDINWRFGGQYICAECGREITEDELSDSGYVCEECAEDEQ